jgi:hypothetical protein
MSCMLQPAKGKPLVPEPFWSVFLGEFNENVKGFMLTGQGL